MYIICTSMGIQNESIFVIFTYNNFFMLFLQGHLLLLRITGLYMYYVKFKIIVFIVVLSFEELVKDIFTTPDVTLYNRLSQDLLEMFLECRIN